MHRERQGNAKLPKKKNFKYKKKLMEKNNSKWSVTTENNQITQSGLSVASFGRGQAGGEDDVGGPGE